MKFESVTSFIRSIAHREQKEVGASVSSHGTTTEIVYPAPLSWPWPRQFEYTREFFCVGSGASCLHEVGRATASKEEHVVNMFSPDPAREARHFVDAGYAEAWGSTLLGRALSTVWSRPLARGASIHEVANAGDMEDYASLPGISNPGTSRDPFIHNFYATVDSEVVAKGQLIALPQSVAYISDMFTRPSHRGMGLCNFIMLALENKARELGATHTCLAPGQEVASFGLYAKYGYESVGSRSVLVCRDARDTAHDT
ncbi:GNAT family N-acetyltransferase [Variovorax sp. ZS18.2.2]|uniref:GNAT family N-acetyltransferase n=1 Tax=Variovorax sp. ZS18.2.2 TaxID=2971255 RepID=UPI0021510960|nr:GNAT family N-acetyltransferase [Variovorax sp. ZS18.2.2]MCR6480506.1 GNAT family N-acetyltransferase [Variovorax sp. ZS18.2.2]